MRACHTDLQQRLQTQNYRLVFDWKERIKVIVKDLVHSLFLHLLYRSHYIFQRPSRNICKVLFLKLFTFSTFPTPSHETGINVSVKA